MNVPSKGKLVVVGGHSRRVGKTCVMEAILRATPRLAWHALKISGHHHRETATGVPAMAGQTARYLAAGAASADLLSLSDADFPQATTALDSLLGEGRHLLVESNRIVRHLRPDLVLFVVDPSNSDWKQSSAGCLECAHALVFSQDGPAPAPLLPLQKMLPAFRLTSWDRTSFGLIEWLHERLPAAKVTSYETPVSDPVCPDSTRRRANTRGSQAHQMGQSADSGFSACPVRGVELV